MKRILFSLVFLGAALSLQAQTFNPFPKSWKWTDTNELACSYESATAGKPAFPVQPEGAVNLTWSPDSTKLAFTRENDLYVIDVATGTERRLTTDGSDLILNGYASWVYYEEIFGRPSRYRAFWWSPDSKKIGFFRFDNTRVPMFPIYSPKGQDGSLRLTRYPKAGEPNPQVRIGIIHLDGTEPIVWADFDEKEDQYFGTPFWGADSREFFVSREPRIQNTLDLYSVNVADGSKTAIYHEESPTWLDWIEGMLFSEKGLYMARCFETGWSQIYFLSYDGKTLKRLTDGPNWRINLLRVDAGKDEVFFTAERDSRYSSALYKVDRKGRITALTDPAFHAASVSFSPDGKEFAAVLSNYTNPPKLITAPVAKPQQIRVIADQKGPDFETAGLCLSEVVTLTTKDGTTLYGTMVYPNGFNPDQHYPVHVDLYGGPDTPLVRGRFQQPDPWYAENGIIAATLDCRAAGHGGRKDLDQIYKHLNTIEISDFVEWAEWLQSLPYVQADKIGVEGFSFGGTMTTMLVFTAPDKYPYGIAGGGVYDWALYDTHYTERFMETPQTNPDGYRDSRVINHVGQYKPSDRVRLKITHGTGDDNVHFQNTLQLIDELQKQGKSFDFMIYPDGMHGYRGYQGTHFRTENHAFWKKHLCSPSPITLPRADATKMGIDTTHYHKVWDVVWSKATDELHSLMVVKDGKVVYERYAPTLNAQTPKVLWSASKTFTSTAVGFAVDEGKLSVNDPVISFFTKEELPDTLDERLKRMTIKDLLTMSSGFSRDLLVDAITSFEGDWAQKALAVPMSREPGSKFAYNSMNTYLLSVIVSRVVGEPMDRYLDRKLFQPLGIKNWTWDHSPQDYPTGGWGLYLCTDDLAKAGQFYLQKGRWNGKQLLSEKWIDEASTKHTVMEYKLDTPLDTNRGYGYQIWRCKPEGSYRMDGAHGQFVIVLPEQNAVIVITGHCSQTQKELDAVWQHILPTL